LTETSISKRFPSKSSTKIILEIIPSVTTRTTHIIRHSNRSAVSIKNRSVNTRLLINTQSKSGGTQQTSINSGVNQTVGNNGGNSGAVSVGVDVEVLVTHGTRVGSALLEGFTVRFGEGFAGGLSVVGLQSESGVARFAGVFAGHGGAVGHVERDAGVSFEEEVRLAGGAGHGVGVEQAVGHFGLGDDDGASSFVEPGVGAASGAGGGVGVGDAADDSGWEFDAFFSVGGEEVAVVARRAEVCACLVCFTSDRVDCSFDALESVLG